MRSKMRVRSKDASSTPPRGGNTMKKSLLSENRVDVGRRYKEGINPYGVFRHA